MAGFIQLHRKLIEWEWYDDLKVFKVFLHCLLRANHKPAKWRGINIDRGEFITSLEKLAQETKLSVQNIRTVIKKLKSTGELTNKGHTSYTIIKVTNYNDYQGTNTQTNIQLTNDQQTTNKQLTTDNNDNNKKNDKNKKKENKFLFDFTSLDGKKYNKEKEFIELWNDFINMRKKIKAPLTEKGAKILLKQGEGFNYELFIRMIEQSISKSWRGIFELKGESEYEQKININRERGKKEQRDRLKRYEEYKKTGILPTNK